MAVQTQRELPKTGETWRHYKGEECLVLGILRNGNKEQPDGLMVAYELVKKTYSSNIENKTLESINTTSITRFYRSIEDFMGTAISERGERVNRFDRVIDDITGEIWEKTFALCEI